MIAVETRQQTGAAKWGWGIVLGLAALLALQGVAIYFTSSVPAFLSRFLGTPLSDVRQSYPAVADHVMRQGQNFAFLVTGLALATFLAALDGLRSGSRWAWNMCWVFPGTLAGIAVNTVARGGAPDFSLILIGLSVAGLLLARKGQPK